MTEPTVEEIVARLEGTRLGQSADMRALIASWRKRGEALKHAKEYMRPNSLLVPGPSFREMLDAALKDKP